MYPFLAIGKVIVAGWKVRSTTFLFIAYGGRLYDSGVKLYLFYYIQESLQTYSNSCVYDIPMYMKFIFNGTIILQL